MRFGSLNLEPCVFIEHVGWLCLEHKLILQSQSRIACICRRVDTQLEGTPGVVRVALNLVFRDIEVLSSRGFYRTIGLILDTTCTVYIVLL